MIKKLIFISALLFIVGCEREATFVCLDLVKVVVSKDKDSIRVSTISPNTSGGIEEVYWKHMEIPDRNLIVYTEPIGRDSTGIYEYNTSEESLVLGGGRSGSVDCPRK